MDCFDDCKITYIEQSISCCILPSFIKPLRGRKMSPLKFPNNIHNIAEEVDIMSKLKAIVAH